MLAKKRGNTSRIDAMSFLLESCGKLLSTPARMMYQIDKNEYRLGI